jgi:hypothetical protein
MAGNGRRMSPELKTEIMARLKRGAKSSELESEYKLSYNAVARLRRLTGTFDTRRGRKRKLSSVVLQQAETRLKNGERWRDVASALAVSPQTLANRLRYRKRK